MNEATAANFTPLLTGDGSYTFFSEQFGEAFHSQQGARQEALQTFVQPTAIAQKAQQPTIVLLDVCYGLGYNTAAALETIWQVNPACRVEWVGLEVNPRVPQAAIERGLLRQWAEPIPSLLTDLASRHQVETDRLHARLWMGDARQSIQSLCQSNLQADAVFLDPFSPLRCPSLWTIEFLAQVATCLKSDGRLATYSCAAAVRSALQAAGLHLGATVAVGRRFPGTVASFSEQLPPLSLQEQEHLQTRAAVPYRDPVLNDSDRAIVQRRQLEQQTCGLESTSRWRKRWGI